MRQINIDRKPKDHLQPWQVFDLIGGTSTGGIIALMLGCLKMSVEECHDTYMKLANTIFKPKRWRCNVFNRSLDLISANERYDSAKMEELVQQIIKERTGSRNAMLQDPLRGFVTTVRADDEELLLLRSYVNNQQPDTHSSQFEMWEALRATSAASTYFKEYRRQNEGYVDGAFKSNNPIFEVHHEAADLWPGRDVFLVSIGTGTKPSAPVGTNAIKLVRTMTKLATATEGSAPGIGAVDLGNSKMIGNVAMRTDTYLRDTGTAREVASCSREMVEIQTKQYTTVHKLSNSERECLKLLSGAGGPYESQRLSIERPVQGTCQWFLSHKAFMSWLKDTSSALLWVTANPGCGKTVLSSFLVDVLSRQSSDAIVCHFFFKAGEVSRQHSHQALCGILQQVFKAYAKAIKFAMDDFSSNDAANFAQNIEALWEVLCLASDSMPSKQIICVIDALDECSEDSRNRLIDLLVKAFPQMTGSRKLLGRLKIIVTSRPWPSIETRFRSLSCVRLRGENESSSLSKDIETMVKAKVERLKVEGTLSPEACAMLETTLAQGADRTFLWASLVLESISRLPSRKMSAVKSALDVTPVDLNQLYENALSDVKDRTASTRLLQVVLAASRPLTLVEVNMAMSISPKHRTVQELLRDIEPNIEYTVKQLGGFFVRVMNSTVHLVHQTARDFLQRTSEKEEATVLESAIYSEGKLAYLLAKGAGGLGEAIYLAAEEGKTASLQMLLTAEDKRTEEERLRSLQSALKAASERGRASTRRILLGAGVPEPEGTNLSAGLAKAVTFGCTKDNIEALVQDGARDVDGEALLSRAVFGDLESITWLFSVLDYPPEVLSQVTSAFFDMHLGDGLRGYLLKTVERVLLSERRRLTSGFAIKPVIGQDQATNEQFLILLSAKRARVPAAKFHQAVCFSIAADERLALFLLKHRSILQDISDVSGEHEYLALACLWGNLDIVKNICEEKRRLGQLPKLPWGLLLRTAVVSGNAKTVRWILENGNNNGHVEATSEVVGEEFAAQWAVVERVLGFASAAASPLDIAARFGYQDVIATLTKDEFEKALKDNKAVILDAFATWCGPCKAIAPVLANLSNVDKNGGLYFVKIDVDEVPDLSQDLGIRAMPTFIIFKNGEKAQEIVGANPPALTQAITALAEEFPPPSPVEAAPKAEVEASKE
ncbi:ankyrin repeat protein [Colletotrichum karsti]|uniref:Ankyrin repeat protein n=1 Tax=Colletotrichum karsti TaxID=1095194 RepID=A0A9P6I0E7_9PEZI|nr:ankyrin repeat protein [Colletotrichum karsti]KAF9874662.1 ankyrin repeat protein [Colletotrichum karsti]